ncbi:hypothetical protein EKO27_g8346 [Xylaria grammica]|uniref:Uncharacterized protein n=1 Tax=Xylaria grammica TaxID=363999 RepID=A0A439CXA2_9PEZI|nr:hypothetical protein EKO27_g8346 [Xylaria grammica]
MVDNPPLMAKETAATADASMVPSATTTETEASVADSKAVAPADESAEPPKPVSVEEVRDEELSDAKPVDAVGSNRKVDEANDEAKPEAKSAERDKTEPPEKKPKTNGTPTNGTVRKPGRPKNDKTAPVPIGKTARKTRSQGAAE